MIMVIAVAGVWVVTGCLGLWVWRVQCRARDEALVEELMWLCRVSSTVPGALVERAGWWAVDGVVIGRFSGPLEAAHYWMLEFMDMKEVI